MTATEHPLTLPMAVYVLYLFVMFLSVFTVRFRAIKNGGGFGRYFKTYSDKSTVPDKFLVLERHVDNQFQVPMLFFVTCVLAITLQKETTGILLLAWVFVVSRFVHSYIHLGKNKLLKRAAVYGFGWISLVCIWVGLLL